MAAKTESCSIEDLEEFPTATGTAAIHLRCGKMEAVHSRWDRPMAVLDRRPASTELALRLAILAANFPDHRDLKKAR